MAVWSLTARSVGLSLGPDNHARLRARRGVQTVFRTARPPRSPATRVHCNGIAGASDAHGRLLAHPSPGCGVLLWVPFATSVAVGPLVFAFFVVFPRPVWSMAKLGPRCSRRRSSSDGIYTPWYHIMRDVGPATGLPDWMTAAVYAVNIVYAGVGGGDGSDRPARGER